VSFILAIIGLMFGLDATWWWISARLARRRTWRRIIAAFMGLQMAALALIIFARMLHRGWDHWLPKLVVSAVFIWHFFGLSLLLIVGVVLLPILLFQTVTRWSRRSQERESAKTDDHRGWSRRDFVGFAAAALPPLYTLSLSGIALAQLNQFRVRRFVLPIRELPSELDGMTIAQVSDMHVGRFTSGRVLRKMVEVVNEMSADLVLLTGDLINDALADLSDGLDLVRAMEARFGLFIIEGNHDLIENPSEFERRVKESGVPFLLDETATISVRGAPLQLLGLSWTRARQNRDEAIARAVRQLVRQRRADAFPILLAHHPHAFDAAAELKMPLTLSGHTHGGQLMLNEQCGFGPALFRYWSGLYTRGDSKLIVSNGVGNWFPLRANAPAEIVHLTLRKEQSA
jgi:predicted MPP superfamily phosphohydrolase